MECCLANGELMRLGGEDLVLRCLQGTLWLTTGDGRDYLLQNGKSFQLQSGAPAIVEALGAARMRLEQVPPEGAAVRAVTMTAAGAGGGLT